MSVCVPPLLNGCLSLSLLPSASFFSSCSHHLLPLNDRSFTSVCFHPFSVSSCRFERSLYCSVCYSPFLLFLHDFQLFWLYVSLVTFSFHLSHLSLPLTSLLLSLLFYCCHLLFILYHLCRPLYLSLHSPCCSPFVVLSLSPSSPVFPSSHIFLSVTHALTPTIYLLFLYTVNVLSFPAIIPAVTDIVFFVIHLPKLSRCASFPLLCRCF